MKTGNTYKVAYLVFLTALPRPGHPLLFHTDFCKSAVSVCALGFWFLVPILQIQYALDANSACVLTYGRPLWRRHRELLKGLIMIPENNDKKNISQSALEKFSSDNNCIKFKRKSAKVQTK